MGKRLLPGQTMPPRVYVPAPPTPHEQLLHWFDGCDGGATTRIAYYGERRARGESHDEAMLHTAQRFPLWVADVWPKRGIELPA